MGDQHGQGIVLTLGCSGVVAGGNTQVGATDWQPTAT